MLKGIGLVVLFLAIEGAFLLHVALPSGIPERAPAGAQVVVRRSTPAVNAAITTQAPAERQGALRVEPCKPSS